MDDKGRKAIELMDYISEAYHFYRNASVPVYASELAEKYSKEWRLFKEDQAITERIAEKRENITANKEMKRRSGLMDFLDKQFHESQEFHDMLFRHSVEKIAQRRGNVTYWSRQKPIEPIHLDPSLIAKCAENQICLKINEIIDRINAITHTK